MLPEDELMEMGYEMTLSESRRTVPYSEEDD